MKINILDQISNETKLGAETTYDIYSSLDLVTLNVV